jgi:ribonuclease HI
MDNETYVLYADGSAINNPGPAGSGAVLTRAGGEVLFTLSSYLGFNTNNYAEYHGLILGAEEALKMGVKKIDIRMDSMLVVNQVNGRWKIKSPHLKELARASQELLSRFQSWSLSYIPREKNSLADSAAKEASAAGLAPSV